MTIQIDTLFDEKAIAERIEALAAEVADAKPEKLLVVGILNGSFIFAADLVRAMHRAGLQPEMAFMRLSSYGSGTISSGNVEIHQDVDSDVNDRDIILVDDILESGRTLNFAKERLLSRGAKSVKIAALLDKQESRKAPIEADYVGFACPDKFVVGYGMDMAHAWRQLPFIGYVVPSDKSGGDS
ncbi:MAG: hypoxanthine phosphoribosyltransferase [Rhodobacteraceae bacterium]|nr:hypoxanthine phosphoribosyltransferase [Paracoccaceae bacterium]